MLMKDESKLTSIDIHMAYIAQPREKKGKICLRKQIRRKEVENTYIKKGKKSVKY